MARSLTPKQRRFVAEYVQNGGNGTRAALAAYDTADSRTASVMAVETLARPSVQAAVAELLDEAGLSDRKLAEIHAHYLALYRSDDPADKALGLKALDMAFRLNGPYRTLDTAAEDFTQAVIEAYARRKVLLAEASAADTNVPTD